MSLVKTLFGRRLATFEAEHAKIGSIRGVPVLGLDALASAAYGPEAALAILIPLGAAGLHYIPAITAVILVLLGILYISYRQTIAAYPSGGGSYIVAKHNLGTGAGLCAAAALVLDYVLNAAVGISAGVGALVSAFPALHEHILALCLTILILIAIVNLRGLRESGAAFGIPTWAFVFLFLGILIAGAVKTVLSGGNPTPIVKPAALPPAASAATLWLLMRSFASGCTAMTGVEAVSNGVPIFKEPSVKHAIRTLTIIVLILAAFLGGIAWLTQAYHIGAIDQTRPSYQSVLSSLIGAIIGRGFLYYATMAALLSVVCLSANTSFAGFPRICRLMAEDDFLPHAFANIGRRLVYTSGIVVLTTLAGVILIAFGGITERLIPLFAVGAFGAFTFSQAGMVVHWRRLGARKHWHRLTINAIGATTTACALIVIVATKFHDGAWMTVLLIPIIILLFRSVRAHYRKVEFQLERRAEIEIAPPESVSVLLPVKSWDNLTEKALRFARALSTDVTALHIYSDPEECKTMQEDWRRYVDEPLTRAGMTPTPLVCISSPYRRLFTPLLNYIDEMRQTREGMVAVILPDLVEARWYEYLLHTQRANVLRSLLLLKGNQRVAVISVPWYLERRRKTIVAEESEVAAPASSDAELLAFDRRQK